MAKAGAAVEWIDVLPCLCLREIDRALLVSKGFAPLEGRMMKGTFSCRFMSTFSWPART